MHKPIAQVGQVKRLRTRPKVAVSVEPSLQQAIHRCDHSVRPTIEFPPTD